MISRSAVLKVAPDELLTRKQMAELMGIGADRVEDFITPSPHCKNPHYWWGKQLHDWIDRQVEAAVRA